MLIQKIKEKEARIGVVGLGYVGLPLVYEFCKAGFHVLGLEIDPAKVEMLNNGKSYIKHISEEKICFMTRESNFQGSTNFSLIKNLDCILICVPTPLKKNREPDMSYIISTAQNIAPHLTKGQLVVLESTTYPGTSQEILAKTLGAVSGLKPDSDFYLAYSPEREDPNNEDYTTATIPKVIGSDTPVGLEIADALYSSIVQKTVLVSGTRVAEATKLMENIFRSVNIALVNELKMVFDEMGIDIWEVISAASTKPFGYMPFYPGPGLGGHCVPIDPFYLTSKAREFGMSTRFIELAGEVNIFMPSYVFNKILSGLNNAGKNVRDSKVLLLGLAYKKNVDDDRESVTFKIMELLKEYGANFEYNDPYIPIIKARREYNQFKGKKSVSLKNLDFFDLVVILTDHSCYDYEKIVEDSKLIIDTRNACKNIESDKIIKA